MKGVTLPQNRIQLTGHTIVVRLSGVQTGQTLSPVKRAVLRLHRSGELQNLLVDLSDVQGADRAARQTTQQLLQELPSGKVAIVTRRSPKIWLQHWLLKTRARTKAHIRIYTGELFAREWLSSH